MFASRRRFALVRYYRYHLLSMAEYSGTTLAEPRFRRWAAPVGLSFVLGWFIVRCASRFAGAGHDDTFITLFAAEHLASGAGFVNQNGQPGEIGSSLLHVLMLALFNLGSACDLYLMNKLLGLAAGSLALVLVFAFRYRFIAFDRGPTETALLAIWFAALVPSYGFWMMGGLETPLVALLLVWLTGELLADAPSSGIRTGIVAFLLTLARPEGFAYLGAVLLWGILAKRHRAWWLQAFALPLLAFSAVTLLRWLWLGLLFPIPVLAKVGTGNTLQRIGSGFHYVVAFGRASILGAVLLLGFVFQLLRLVVTTLARPTPKLQMSKQALSKQAPMVILFVHVGIVIGTGGDWMTYSRFLAPVIPLLGLVTAALVWSLPWQRWTSRPFRFALVGLFVLGLPFLASEKSDLFPPYIRNTCTQQSFSDLVDPHFGPTLGERVRRLNHPYHRDATQLRPFLLNILGPVARRPGGITVATYQMGFFPYEVSRLKIDQVRFVDTVGIVDAAIASLHGERTPRGLATGLDPITFLDPDSRDPIARAIQNRQPDLVYILSTSPAMVRTLQRWNWLLIWNAPEAKIFARRGLIEKPG
jgi:hypothetical protein